MPIRGSQMLRPINFQIMQKEESADGTERGGESPVSTSRDSRLFTARAKLIVEPDSKSI